ncbi:MAG: HD domain-containing protein [Lachnospiraceae bacterium]
MKHQTVNALKWKEEWSYVEQKLKESGCDNFGGGTAFSRYPFRSRFLHIRRVMKWAERIRPDFGKIDQDVLELAIIFHDVGYSLGDNKNHQENSRRMFRAYREEMCRKAEAGIWKDAQRLDQVEFLIENHSRKELLGTPDLMPELELLIEADALDEEGAMRIAWDCMAEGMGGGSSFQDALEHTEKFWNPSYAPMVTPRAKRFWEEKQQLVRSYIAQLRSDLEMAHDVEDI